MNQNLINVNDMVSLNGEQVITTSLQVAKYFGKSHKHVLRAIRNLECSKEFMSAHFWAYVENQQVGTARRNMEHYQMDKDGFMFLVMGFTGKQAAQLKEAYINAFNWMYKQLSMGKAEIVRKYNEAIERELLSFKNGSQAGKALYQRKLEKQRNQAELLHLEKLLEQPDLFINAA